MPDLWTYNSLANVLGSCGEWERAVGLLDDMRARGLTPDVVTYSSLVSACQKAGQVLRKPSILLVYILFELQIHQDITYCEAKISGEARRFIELLSLSCEPRAVYTP